MSLQRKNTSDTAKTRARSDSCYICLRLASTDTCPNVHTCMGKGTGYMHGILLTHTETHTDRQTHRHTHISLSHPQPPSPLLHMLSGSQRSIGVILAIPADQAFTICCREIAGSFFSIPALRWTALVIHCISNYSSCCITTLQLEASQRRSSEAT